MTMFDLAFVAIPCTLPLAMLIMSVVMFMTVIVFIVMLPTSLTMMTTA